MSDIIFTDGMKVFKPRDNAPAFVKADVIVDVAKFTVFLHDHAKPDGTVRIQIKEGNKGPYYASLDQWTATGNAPNAEPRPVQRSTDEEIAESIPF